MQTARDYAGFEAGTRFGDILRIIIMPAFHCVCIIVCVDGRFICRKHPSACVVFELAPGLRHFAFSLWGIRDIQWRSSAGGVEYDAR